MQVERAEGTFYTEYAAVTLPFHNLIVNKIINKSFTESDNFSPPQQKFLSHIIDQVLNSFLVFVGHMTQTLQFPAHVN